MDRELMKKILKRQVPVSAVVAWLEGNCEIKVFCNFCRREEFVKLFLNYLRDQQTSILPSETPVVPMKEMGLNRVSESRPFKVAVRRNRHGRKKSGGGSPAYTERNPVESNNEAFQALEWHANPIAVKKTDKIRDSVPPAFAMESVSERDMNSLMQRFQRSLGNNVNNVTYESKPSVISTSKSTKNEIMADPFFVSHIDELNIIADIYCCLINSNYIPNLMTEFCFIISLLVVQPSITQEKKSDENIEIINYLDNVHNCVFFASLMLSHQKHLLQHFDTVTLKMLADNSRLRKFKPELCNFISDAAQNRTKQKASSAETVKYNENVSFLYEADKRANFPNDHTFHAFCKQRDGFYELLQIWEANYQSADWSFSSALGSRVRTLLSLHDDPGNYFHISGLFKSLLLTRCSRFNQPMEIQENHGSLSFSKDIDPEKVKCLHEGLVTPYNLNDCTLFPGHQEFFRDFIVHSSNPAFIQHLSDSFISEIMELNSSFLPSDVEDTDLSVDDSTKRRYQTTLETLRLLGKFTGFIAFLPYHSQSAVLSENIIAAQASVRDKIRPSLDVLQCLTDATEKKELILTLPWVLEYLSQMDSIALHLSYFRSVFEILFQIHQKVQFHKGIFLDWKRKMPGKASLMIRLLLGRFFDSPNFPKELFFKLALKYRISFCNSDEQGRVSQLVYPALDELDIVDEHCLCLCCPFMGQLKLYLMKDPESLSGNPGSRKMPDLASFHETLEASPSDEVQMDPEETFLHNHPVSTQSIEYVAERVASCCVKYIRTEITSWAKERAASRVETELAIVQQKYPLDNYHTLEVALANKFDELALLGCKEIKRRCDTELKDYCYSRCNKDLPPLMAHNEKPDIVNTCVQISGRKSWEKVSLWIDAHLSEGQLIKDLKAELYKTLRRQYDEIKQENLPEVRPCDESTLPRMVVKLKALTSKLLNDSQNADHTSEIHFILDSIKGMIEHSDIPPKVKEVLPSLTADLLVSMVIYQPEFVNLGALDNFLSVLVKAMPTNLERLVCPRNILLLCQSKHPPEIVWRSMSQLISYLLAKNFLSPVAVEEQCIALLQRPWPQDILSLMSGCYRDILENLNKFQNCEADTFSLTMSWLPESSGDMGFFLDDYHQGYLDEEHTEERNRLEQLNALQEEACRLNDNILKEMRRAMGCVHLMFEHARSSCQCKKCSK